MQNKGQFHQPSTLPHSAMLNCDGEHVVMPAKHQPVSGGMQLLVHFLYRLILLLSCKLNLRGF